MKKKYYSLLFILVFISACTESFLDVLPEDKITDATFWTSESDVDLALNGIYSVLRERSIFGAGPSFEACTPDGFQWAHWNGKLQQIGNGSATPSTGEFIPERWTMCYRIIYRSNYLLENIDRLELDADKKANITGQTHFLRGIAYALLAETYGDVPIVDKVISAQEAREFSQSSQDEIWTKAISDYDMAIQNLSPTATEVGKATKGAAIGMKLRAMLYQNKYTEVLQLADDIDALNLYSLFPSYEGLFQVENENNAEVIFDIQFIDGEQGQGNFFAWLGRPSGIKSGLGGASDVAPTQIMVDKYEMIDGSEVDVNNPFEGRDPRLDFSILRPGASYEGELYPGVISNHTGQRVGYGMRKYTAEGVNVNTARQVPLNFIILRYGDILMAKAEALIETGGNLPQAIGIINRFRTERNDVKITSLPLDLSQEEAREALRKERRIEFYLEGTYWSDIKRWNIGTSLYPVEVRAGDGSLIEIKFPNGYKPSHNLLPIPDDELSLNNKLKQNDGW